jgi:hypothetical protein
MKAVYGILGLIIVVGVCYLVAFFGIIPTQKIADGSPGVGKVLVALHLAKARAKPKPLMSATPPPPAVDPFQQALADGQKQLAADRAKLDANKAAFAQSKPQSSGTQFAGTAARADTQAKLLAIYATMSADDLAQIMSKQSDQAAIDAIMSLDEKKAGKVLAALPTVRAARISMIMAHSEMTATKPSGKTAPSAAQQSPKTVLQ